jgi:hypothetical protein
MPRSGGAGERDGARERAVSIAELWGKEGIRHNVYYTWSNDLPETGKKRLREIRSGT